MTRNDFIQKLFIQKAPGLYSPDGIEKLITECISIANLLEKHVEWDNGKFEDFVSDSKLSKLESCIEPIGAAAPIVYDLDSAIFLAINSADSKGITIFELIDKLASSFKKKDVECYIEYLLSAGYIIVDHDSKLR